MRRVSRGPQWLLDWRVPTLLRRAGRNARLVVAPHDRPWGSSDPPAVAYSYAPGRGARHACALFAGFNGVLQVDAYAGYNHFADASRSEGAVAPAYCWSHFRRQFYNLAKGGPKAEGLSSTRAPIATAALDKIGALYAIEDDIRGQPADVRRAARRVRTVQSRSSQHRRRGSVSNS